MARRKSFPSGSGVHVPDGMGGYLGSKSIGMATRIQNDDLRLQAMSDTRNRMCVAAVVFCLFFAVLGVRLVDVALIARDHAATENSDVPSSNGNRADIVDRRGDLLATNLLSSSLYADLSEVWNAEQTAQQLHQAIPALDEGRLLRRLKSDRKHVQLTTHLTPRQKQKVFSLGLPGLVFPRHERRFYPRGRDAAHLVGYVNQDNVGIAGAEMSLEQDIVSAGPKGQSIALSLDMRIQHVLRDELIMAREKFRAVGAAGVFLDVHNGQIVALASLPDFDANNPMAVPDRHRFNQVTKGVYEMGSVFKMFTVAMALEAGTVSLDDGFDTSRPLRIARHTINDFHGENRWLTVPEIFVYSSNIGTAKIAREVGIPYHQAFLRKMGLYDRSPVELPEVGTPKVPSEWREIRAATISYGHGIAVSPLQLASAAAALVNGGVLHQATLRHRPADRSRNRARVISPVTSRQMRALLRMVVNDGTGSKAFVEGYDVGGKTGTAEKSRAGGYSRNTLLTSFVATFPAHNPQYVLLIMLDEPKATEDTYGYATAGWTAAPVASNVIRRSGPILGIAPTKVSADGLQQAMLSMP